MGDFGARNDIVEVGKRMYRKGFVASNDGNLSIRISEKEILITPSGVSKGYMNASDLLIVDLSGNVLSGRQKPSSEMKMHLAVYKNRPDVYAVCHAHPQITTAFAVARKICDKIALPEVIFSIGCVALSDYATPTTEEVPDSIAGIIKTSDAVLLSNHGALTVGHDIYDAYYKMETLEHFAGITLYARLLGGEVGLEPLQISELLRIRKDVYGKSDLGFLGDGYCGGKALEETGEIDKLVRTITQSVMENLKNIGE